MITIDAKGRLCPEPLIMTKKALKNAEKGQRVTILIDNETSCSNLTAYLEELGIKPDKEERENCTALSFTFEGLNETNASGTSEEQCIVTPAKKGYCVVIKSEFMGEGDNELGALLMRAYLNTLPETTPLPSDILLYNGGVKLAVEGTDTSKALAKLEAAGVKIMSCGTCVDFYGLKERIKIGTIGNMYKIAQTKAEASRVVYP